MVTVPMIGWMPKLGPGRARLSSYSIAKYGPQTGNDAQWFPDAGNGISVTNNALITWNDPTDAHFLTNSLFQQAWIRHLTNKWGVARNGGVRFYCMDNEHTLWHSTHRDVHPVGSSNFANWIPVQTNTLAGTSMPIALPATNAWRFYRAQWLP